MIKPIPDLPEKALGFSAHGKVTANDYESVIIPAVEALFAGNGKVRFLYYLGEDFAGFEAGAIWDDAKLGFRHFTGWEKIAVVSDIEWIRDAAKLFGIAIPAQVRVFHNRELADAICWVGE